MKEKPEFYPILLAEVDTEIENAERNYLPFHNLHEGYAVLLEEVDELWNHVKCKQFKRNKSKIHNECIQVAAMACRIIINLEKNSYMK